MSKGSPSMVALLGLLAVAGYQNRDKLQSMLQQAGNRDDDARGDGLALDTGGSLLDAFRTTTANGGLLAGLSELLGRFANPVQQAKAQSWVDTGPNGDLGPDDLEEVLDPDTMTDLMQQTGLGRAELLQRLSAILPQAVDQLTPDGRLPAAGPGRGIY